MSLFGPITAWCGNWKLQRDFCVCKMCVYVVGKFTSNHCPSVDNSPTVRWLVKMIAGLFPSPFSFCFNICMDSLNWEISGHHLLCNDCVLHAQNSAYIISNVLWLLRFEPFLFMSNGSNLHDRAQLCGHKKSESCVYTVVPPICQLFRWFFFSFCVLSFKKKMYCVLSLDWL